MQNLEPRLQFRSLVAIDAATCALMGLLLLLAPAPLANLTAISEALLFGAGLLLLPVATFMAFLSRCSTTPTWAARIVISGNALWVLGSVLLPAFGLITPNGIGWLFLLSQSLVVALLTWLEWVAARFVFAPV